MDTNTFFNNVTSVTVYDADEPIETEGCCVSFSYGDNLPKIVCGISDDALTDFLEADETDRARIMHDVFRLYSTEAIQ